MMNKQVRQIKKAAKIKQKQVRYGREDFLPTGSTLVNLASSGRVSGGFLKGKYILLAGKSNSGKTWLSLNALAEAAINPTFDDYELVYDDVEGGAEMDFRKYFGRAFVDRVRSPAYNLGKRVHSTTIEEFYFHVDDLLNRGKPFIYVLDSMDGLSSKDEQEKFDEQKEGYRTGKKVAGSYGDGKAKKNSSGIRRVVSRLRRSGSILIVIAQTRDNLGFGFESETRSGGRALKFYATTELWFAVKKKLTRLVRGKKRGIGTLCQITCKRTRLTGQDHVVDVPIYHSFGIDDVGSCVDFLCEEKHWRRAKGRIVAPEFKFKGKREVLIRQIEGRNRERTLRGIVSRVWQEIQAACAIKRKVRYT